MGKFLSAREEGDQTEGTHKVVAYLSSIFHGSHTPQSIGIRTSREMRTLAEALDALQAGKLPEVADLLVQRFKALETSIQDGNWNLAKRLEVIPDSTSGLTSMEERRAAARDELQSLQLLQAKTRVEGKHPKG